ncbi:YihY/virulence factor BrkB family protein [Aldersonia kunmingensis]|uniref:YihY/virulence factor BrkB family protein n=1 Tax=Aldersonia kunmingensis TaxID=408066 RepID=UPI000AA0F889
MANRLDRMQQRRRPIGFTLGVFYKFFDDQGGYLAALITYYGFIALFPLLLLLTTVTGIILDDHPEWQEQLVDSALSQFPVIGEQLDQPRELSGGPVAITIGVIGAIYGALGVGVAVQNASNVAWAVPRNERPDPILVRIRSVRLLLTVGLGLIGIAVISNIGSALVEYGMWRTIGVTVLTLLLDFGVFILAFRISVAHPIGTRDVVVGAAVAAVGWQALQQFGYLFTTRVIQGSSTTNGVFALVLGLLAFIYPVCLAHGVQHRDQHRVGEAPVSAIAADAVHRQCRADRGGPPRLHPCRRSAAAQGIPAGRRELRAVGGGRGRSAEKR